MRCFVLFAVGFFRKKKYDPDDIMSNGQKYLAKQLADEVERLKQSVKTICELVKSGEKIDRRIALEDAKKVIRLLDKGAIKIAEQIDSDKWQVNGWIKSAISLLFLEQNRAIAGFGASSSMT